MAKTIALSGPRSLAPVSVALCCFLSSVTHAAAQNAPAAPFALPHLPPCADSGSAIQSPCVLPASFDAQDAARRIGQRDHVWWVDGDRLNLLARTPAASPLALCCTVMTPLAPIAGTGLSSVTVRLPRMREAILEISLFPQPFYSAPDMWRGPDAPPAPPRAEPLAGHVTVYDFPSKILGESRRVTIYVPPGLPKGRKAPVLYLADDLATSFAPIAEAAIKTGRVRPIILVGIAAAKPSAPNCSNFPCDRRGLEYLIDANGGDVTGDNPFTRHMRFVADELLPYVEAHFPVLKNKENRGVGGSSNGGDWAVAAAALHPDLFGNVMAMSVATRASVEQAGHLGSAKVFGGSGILEPSFLKTTQATIDRAKAAGAKTKASMPVTGHSPPAWDVMFAEGEMWLLPKGG